MKSWVVLVLVLACGGGTASSSGGGGDGSAGLSGGTGGSPGGGGSGGSPDAAGGAAGFDASPTHDGAGPDLPPPADATADRAGDSAPTTGQSLDQCFMGLRMLVGGSQVATRASADGKYRMRLALETADRGGTSGSKGWEAVRFGLETRRDRCACRRPACKGPTRARTTTAPTCSP